jgi:uncharacterized protein HemY
MVTAFICGFVFAFVVLFIWELVSVLRRSRDQRRYAAEVFRHKHQTQTERAGSVEHFKRVMGRADEIDD